jgi:hypothetical protein
MADAAQTRLDERLQALTTTGSQNLLMAHAGCWVATRNSRKVLSFHALRSMTSSSRIAAAMASLASTVRNRAPRNDAA